MGPSISLFLSFILMVCTLPAGAAQREGKAPRPVAVAPAHFQDVSRSIKLSALLVYKSTQKLAFKVGGPLAELAVEEGDFVEKGQLLAKLDTEEIQAQVKADQARYEQTLRSVKRLKSLHQQKVASLEQLQSAETERDVAEAKLRVSRFNLRYSVIKAPAAGRIVQRNIETGELISPSQVAFVLADESRGWIMETGLSDRQVVRVQKGDPVSVSFDPWPLQTVSGRVSQIAEAAERNSGLFTVEMALDNTASLRLRQGYVGRIEIRPALVERLVLLPALALASARSPLGTVFVLNDDQTVSERQVRIHHLEAGQVAVSGDIRDGDQVVTIGAAFVHDGDKVRVTAMSAGQGE